jgi:hypothetical protein
MYYDSLISLCPYDRFTLAELMPWVNYCEMVRSVADCGDV